jgi:hypothetical protein
MDFVSLIISTVLFAAFVPGVLGTFPKGASKSTVLVVHGVAFAVVASLVMSWYWSMKERMTNWGDRCPNGYTLGLSKDGKQDCVPVGTRTY